MTRKVIGNLVLGQACLFGGLMICVALKPKGLTANDGISYYGIFVRTAVPYAFALLGSVLCVRRALRWSAPSSPNPAYLHRVANWLAAMSLGVVLTPYSASLLFDWAHTLLGAAVFVLQLVLGAQLLNWSGGDAWVAAFLVTQFLSGVVCAVYVLPKHGWLIQGQVAFQLAFGALLMRTARVMTPQPTAPVTQTT
jgi:hypothetical protein